MARREPCDTRGKRGELACFDRHGKNDPWVAFENEPWLAFGTAAADKERGTLRRWRLPSSNTWRAARAIFARLRRSRGRAIHEAASSEKSEGAVFAYSSPCPSQLGRASRAKN